MTHEEMLEEATRREKQNEFEEVRGRSGGDRHSPLRRQMKSPMYAYGLITGFGAGALYFMAPAIIDSFRPEPLTPPVVEKHGTFTVVSAYKGCDLVQWQYGMLYEYKYFLHCPK